jgi:AAHS family 4-hydroxybenzoate transporter-like MFS transporter
MIPLWGWRSVLMLGGIAPLVLTALMMFVLPESIRYMVAKQHRLEKIRSVLMRISSEAADATSFVKTEQAVAAEGQSGAALVISRPYAVGTVMLWTAYFMGLVIFYALINWMPVLFKDAGMDPRTATLIAALFPLGGVGAVLFGWLMDRYNANWVIAIGYVLTALSVFAIGQVIGSFGLLVVVVFAAGTLMNTAQSSMPALAAAFYPTQGRATGIAWMLGIGRFGGIAGSYLVAVLTGLQLGFAGIFSIVGIAGLIAAMALVIKQLAQPEHKSRYAPSRSAHLAH